MKILNNKTFRVLLVLIIFIVISGLVSNQTHAVSDITVNGSVEKRKIKVELTNDNIANTITINLFPNDQYFAEQFVGFNFVYPGLSSTGNFNIVNNTGQTYKVTDYSFEAYATFIKRVYNDAATNKYGGMTEINKNIVANLSGEEWYQLNAEYYGAENFYDLDVARKIFGYGDLTQGSDIGYETSKELIALGEWYLFNKSQFSFNTDKYPINNLNVQNITLQDYIDKTFDNKDLVLNNCFSQEIGENGFTSTIGYSIDNPSVGNAYNGAYSDFKFTLTLSRVINGVRVYYDGNGNTDGIAPSDNNQYEIGSSVVVLDNIGHLVKEGFTFNEWNTSPDGNGTQLKAGDSFFIDSDITLYALWVPVTDPPITIPKPTDTPEPEPTPIVTPEPTATATPEPEPTPIDTPKPTATDTPEPEPTPTATPEPTATATPEPEPTPIVTPEPTATVTPEPEPTPIATPEPTATPEPEPTPIVTPEPTATATPEPEPTPIVTPEPTATPEPEPTPNATPKPTATATPEPEPTPIATPEPTATPTPEPTPIATPKPTATATPEPEPTPIATPKPTATVTPEPEPTPIATPKPTATATPEPEPTPIATPKPTATDTPEPEPTPIATPKPTAAATPEPEPTPIATPTATATPEPQVIPPEITEMIYPDTSHSNLKNFYHIRYIYGYPDGSVRPDNSITRSETASIFFRLLTNSTKSGIYTSNFNDVSNDSWYSQAVNYLAYMGVITGYEDNTFRPEALITRAEFATIVAGFDSLVFTDENIFSDVLNNHWAAKYINSAYKKGWVNGYSNGTFKPEQSITRVEVVKLVNTMLNRLVDSEDLDDSLNPFNDLTRDHWGFAHVLEASIEHFYTKNDNGTEIWNK